MAVAIQEILFELRRCAVGILSLKGGERDRLEQSIRRGGGRSEGGGGGEGRGEKVKTMEQK